MKTLTKPYQDLLSLVARNGAINGEKAMDTMEKNAPDTDLTNTKKMTEDFRALEDKINNAPGTLNSLDFVHLWVGASLSRMVIQRNIDTWTAVVKAYDEDLIPKLYEVANHSADDKWTELAEQYFCSEENQEEKN